MFQVDETIAGYRIVSKLGAGGMGEVWLAEDTKLGREVALKVLPIEFAEDADRLARFEREAKVLASLNHPNIATLFGLETVASGADADADAAAGTGADDNSKLKTQNSELAPPAVTFLAMELVEGEDLSERISRGPIPVDEAVPMALQIAEALEAAHQQSIVHRDLKPANIKLRSDGTVKVLDFGLAKAWEAESTDQSLSLSPTMTQHATAAGIILGTAAYMAPEQAAGLGTDTRADIWSFGVVLWEMLTGVKLFDGQTVSHVLAAVLKDEPDLSELPEATPPRIAELVGRCLRKDPKMRIQAIGDVRIALDEYLADPEAAAQPAATASPELPTVPGWKRVIPWAAAGALGLVVAALLLIHVLTPTTVVRATIPPPKGMNFDLRPASPGPAVVSPDGTSVAFTAVDEDSETRVFVRRLDAGEAHALSGTEGAQYPFWAPDSRWLGFFTQPGDTLRKIDTTGGPPITLCPAGNGKGGSWSPDGVIVFAAGSSTGLSRVSSAGGESAQITSLDPEKHNSHRLPWFLPDGRHFLFVARGVSGENSSIMIGSLDSQETIEFMHNESQAAFAEGRLLFVRDQTLMAQPFDPDALATTAEAVPVAEDVLVIQGAELAVFGVSGNGVLTFQTGSSVSEAVLEWRDRAGQSTGELSDPALYRTVTLSPDSLYAVAQAVDMETGTQDLWVFELERNIRTRFTFDPLADVAPVWSPDGATIFFASNRDGEFSVFRKPLSGIGEVELVASFDGAAFPESVSPDGRHVSVMVGGKTTGGDIYLVDLESGNETTIFRKTDFNEGGSAISPDGRWITFNSDESGDFEVFVTTFPEAGRKWQISTGGGVYPEWRADGREIIYTDIEGNLVSVQVDGRGETFDVGAWESLFAIEVPDAGGSYFSVAADAQSFLVIPGVSQKADTLLNLVVNWPEQIEARR